MSSPNPRAGGDPFSRQQNPNAPPRSGRSPPTSPERGAATVAVGELFSDLSIRRPQPAGNDDDDDFIVAEMIGLGAPAPIEDFEDVGLAPAVLENVGYEFPTLLQSFSIPVVMAGRDLLVVSSAMSTGKSASICLPVVSRLLQTGPGQRIGIPMPRTVILASTIERATAIYEEAKKCSYNTHLSVVMLIADSSLISQVCNVSFYYTTFRFIPHT
ncbi:DEAD-box ATP-dependent RNA helicase 52A-like [Lolium perenne]|uniref:DEAD-box ATP-dependent RNA helicase 52A-like n=1 Tax=Lolium perenne TaxID=4522 RepID=UPI0021F67A7A|nr:DEAD-box ATP-dependent RNA helicase 52A-like [Lolium perenne]